MQGLCLPNKLSGLSSTGQDFPGSLCSLPLALGGVESFSQIQSCFNMQTQTSRGGWRFAFPSLITSAAPFHRPPHTIFPGSVPAESEMERIYSCRRSLGDTQTEGSFYKGGSRHFKGAAACILEQP